MNPTLTKKRLTLKECQERNILILVGRGKSALTNFIERVFLMENGLYTIYGIKELIKHTDDVKKEVEHGIFKVIVHLELESDVKKIPLGIIRRSLVYKTDF